MAKAAGIIVKIFVSTALSAVFIFNTPERTMATAPHKEANMIGKYPKTAAPIDKKKIIRAFLAFSSFGNTWEDHSKTTNSELFLNNFMSFV